MSNRTVACIAALLGHLPCALARGQWLDCYPLLWSSGHGAASAAFLLCAITLCISVVTITCIMPSGKRSEGAGCLVTSLVWVWMIYMADERHMLVGAIFYSLGLALGGWGLLLLRDEIHKAETTYIH